MFSQTERLRPKAIFEIPLSLSPSVPPPFLILRLLRQEARGREGGRKRGGKGHLTFITERVQDGPPTRERRALGGQEGGRVGAGRAGHNNTTERQTVVNSRSQLLRGKY